MTDHSTKALVTRADKPVDRRITGKLAAAIERMVELGETWDVAARNVDFTVRGMRKAMEKPHVIAFLRRRRQVFREAASAANIKRLCEIRDAADNMPAVQAIRALEQLGETEDARPAGRATQPGIVIVIGGARAAEGGVHGPVIDLETEGDKKDG